MTLDNLAPPLTSLKVLLFEIIVFQSVYVYCRLLLQNWSLFFIMGTVKTGFSAARPDGSSGPSRGCAELS